MSGRTIEMLRPFDAAHDRHRCLSAAMAVLVGAEGEEDVVAGLLAYARAIAGADGIAISRREGEEVSYLAEDSIAPLWAGRRFPIDACLSGTAMLQNRAILIPDILDDLRVPLATYAPTFVRSLLILPVGTVRPRLALGAYWAAARPIGGQALDLLTLLTASARLALERIHGSPRPGARRAAA